MCHMVEHDQESNKQLAIDMISNVVDSKIQIHKYLIMFRKFSTF